MCAECKFTQCIKDNHEELHPICVCKESENFLKKISYAFDNCDSGVVDDYGEDKEMEGDK